MIVSVLVISAMYFPPAGTTPDTTSAVDIDTDVRSGDGGAITVVYNETYRNTDYLSIAAEGNVSSTDGSSPTPDGYRLDSPGDEITLKEESSGETNVEVTVYAVYEGTWTVVRILNAAI